jgi:hypothetical protein
VIKIGGRGKKEEEKKKQKEKKDRRKLRATEMRQFSIAALRIIRLYYTNKANG